MIHETKQRSLVKALSWRLIILITDFSIVYLLSGKAELATGFAIIKFFFGILLYFFHERIWNSIHWGRESLNPKT